MRGGEGSRAGGTRAWSPNMGKAPPAPAFRQPVASVRVRSYSCKNIYGWLSPATAYKQVFRKNSVGRAEAVKWFAAPSLWKVGWLFLQSPRRRNLASTATLTKTSKTETNAFFSKNSQPKPQNLCNVAEDED